MTSTIRSKRLVQPTVVMSLSIFIILLQLLPIATNCDVFCPKDIGPIYPCSCQNGTQGLLIRCTKANLAILSNSLKSNIIQDPIEQLEIENSSITKLFGALFSDSSTYKFHSTIRELDVRNSQLKSIQAHVFSTELLTNIQYLQLDRNQLPVVPIDLVNNMTQLRLLNLSSNHVTSIEQNSFQKLTNLSELDLSYNRISRLAKNAFAGLSSLEYLNLNGNELIKLDKNIFAFGRKLKHLDISNNKLQTLDRQDLNELTALETLKLAYNQLTTLPRSIFSRNAKLYNLDLSFNKLDDIDTYLFKSTRFLKDLNMSGNLIKEITKNTFSPTTRIKRINLSQNLLQALSSETFKGLEWLELIDLSHNQIVNISNDAFSRIFQVEIDLSFNKLTRIFYWSFHEVSNMTKLNLSHNLIDDGISLIAFESTDCAELDLSYNLIQDISKIPISNLTGIRFLNISHNQITEFNKKSFTQKVPLYELHTIDASYNNISQISGNILERLKSVRYINLSHNSLRRLTSGGFGNSPTLIELDLSYNNLVEIVSGTLVGLVSLKNLDLSYNRLKKMIPVPVALNSIHLEYNEIGQLSKSAFPALNSLLELYLDHNRITNLDEGTFSTLLALHTLELSNNNLSTIPALALKDLSSLQNLRLDGNNIQRLQRKAFGTLPIVFNLRLDYNNISSLVDHSFDGMLQLLNLNLSHNNIVELPPETFAGLVSLRTLDLSHNQLNRFENKSRSAMEDLLSLEVANFSYNKLSLITSRTFLNSPYIPFRLTRLDLSNNLIGILVNDFASGLKKVEWLSLRNNIINEIQPHVISNITQLRYLDLSHNKLRQLKEGSFEPGKHHQQQQILANLTTLLLNNNKLTTIQTREFDKLKSLSYLDLSSNRLEVFFGESNRWIRRGMAIDLRNNNMECSCDQLPLIAWIDSFKARNSSYMMINEHQQQSTNNINRANNQNNYLQQDKLSKYLTPRLLPQYNQAVQLIAGIRCSKPEIISGKPIMQMVDLVSTSPSSTMEFNCDRDLIEEADRLRRLKAPIQFIGAEPYFLNGEQHLQIGWTVLDSQIDLLSFTLLKAKLQQPIDMTLISSSPSSLRQKGPNDVANSIQLLEHEVEYIPYNEKTFVLRDLDPSQFYIVCITYKTSGSDGVSSPSTMIEQLNSSTTTTTTSATNSQQQPVASSKSALFAAILADFNQVNCVSLNSLLRQDTSERLISSSQRPYAIQFELLLLITSIFQALIMYTLLGTGMTMLRRPRAILSQ